MILLSFTWDGKLSWHNATEYFQLGKLDKEKKWEVTRTG